VCSVLLGGPPKRKFLEPLLQSILAAIAELNHRDEEKVITRRNDGVDHLHLEGHC
jgi:hypothetical protein